MRRPDAWRLLATFSLTVAATMVLLAFVGLALSQVPAAGAAGLCAAVFFVPGLFFLNRTRRRYLRDTALAHAARLAERKGVTEAAELAQALDVPTKDAEMILRKAIAEGALKGELNAQGRFVSPEARRCPRCQEPIAKDARPAVCPRCGAPLEGAP